MSNKIIYSCDASDEGSDMDVSDTDDGAQIYKQQQRRRSSATTKTINVSFFSLSRIMHFK